MNQKLWGIFVPSFMNHWFVFKEKLKRVFWYSLVCLYIFKLKISSVCTKNDSPPRQDLGGVFWLCSRLPSGDFCSWSSEADLWVCESIWVVLWGTEHMFLSTAVQWQRILSLQISKNTVVCHLLRRNITHRVHFSGELQSSQPFHSLSLCFAHFTLICLAHFSSFEEIL